MTKPKLSKHSQARIDRFVDEFISSEYVQAFAAERDSDFFNEPERAARVAEACEYGGYGATHAEVIQDWRDAFTCWLRDRKGWNETARFEAAVEANFNATEEWHRNNGSLHQEIG